MRRPAVFVVAALAALVVSGCIGAYQTAPVAPVATGELAPTLTDPDAGLVGLDPTFDVRAYTVLLVDRIAVNPSEVKDDEDRELAARVSPLFQTELIARARSAGLFERVVNLAETTYTATEGARVLRLEGGLTRLDAGSRALRYFVGFGAGASKAQIETRVIDVATGKAVLVTADRREAAFGMFGGDSEEHLREAVSDSARDFVKYLVRLKASGPMAATSGGAAAVATGGTWRDSAGSVLRIGSDLAWDFETRDSRVSAYRAAPASAYRASGTGGMSGDELVLKGRLTGADSASLNRELTLTLTRDGKFLRGTVLGPRGVPFAVEFERAP